MTDALHECTTNTNPNSNVNVTCQRIGKPWKISQQGIEFIKGWEAFRAEMYDHDGAGGKGNATIGYGHLVHTGPISGAASEKPFLKGLTEQQAVQLMEGDLAAPERIINENINVALYQYEYDALVDFVYNHRGHNSEMFATVNSGHFDRVPPKFSEYTLAGGKHPKGLVKRRQAEANLFKDGDYDASH